MLINASQTHFDPLRWIIPAAAKKDVRGYLNGVQFDDERIVATDGHRLHLWAGLFSGQGLHLTAKNTTKQIVMEPVEDPGKFPDIDKVIPNALPVEDQKPLSHKLPEESYVRTLKMYHDTDISTDWDHLFNYQYFLDMLRCPVDLFVCKAEKGGPLKLVSEDGDYAAVLMPMRRAKD